MDLTSLDSESLIATVNALLEDFGISSSITPTKPLLIALGVVLLSPLVYTFLSLVGFGLVWIFWLSVSLLFGLVQSVYVIFQFILIFSDVSLLSSLKATRLIITHATRLNPARIFTGRSPDISKRRRWRDKVDACTKWDEYVKVVQQEGLGDMDYKPEGDKRGRLGRRSLSSRALKEEADAGVLGLGGEDSGMIARSR